MHASSNIPLDYVVVSPPRASSSASLIEISSPRLGSRMEFVNNTVSTYSHPVPNTELGVCSSEHLTTSRKTSSKADKCSGPKRHVAANKSPNHYATPQKSFKPKQSPLHNPRKADITGEGKVTCSPLHKEQVCRSKRSSSVSRYPSAITTSSCNAPAKYREMEFYAAPQFNNSPHPSSLPIPNFVLSGGVSPAAKCSGHHRATSLGTIASDNANKDDDVFGSIPLLSRKLSDYAPLVPVCEDTLETDEEFDFDQPTENHQELRTRRDISDSAGLDSRLPELKENRSQCLAEMTTALHQLLQIRT